MATIQEQTRLVKNTILIGISRASGLLSLLILMPIMTARLSSADYGVLDLIVSYGALLIPVLLLALEQGAFRFLMDVRDSDEDKKRIVSTALFTFLPVFSIFALLYLAVALFLGFHLAVVLFMYMIALGVSVFTGCILRGLGKNKEFAISGIIQVACNVLFVCVALLWLEAGVQGVFVAYALSCTAAGGYNIVAGRIYRYVSRAHINKGTRRELLAYSIPSIPNSVSWWVLSAANRTIIVIVLGAAANGIFAVANRFASVLAMAVSVFGMAWFESATLNYNKVTEERDAFFTDIFNKEIAVFGCMASLLLAATSLGFPILVDSAFHGGYLFVPILIFGGFMGVIINFYSGIYVAKKLAKKTMVMSFQTALLNLAVLLSLIWVIGLWAVPLSTAIAYSAMAVYRFFDVKKYVTITYDKKIFARVGGVFVVTTVLYYSPFWLPGAWVASTYVVAGQSVVVWGVSIFNVLVIALFSLWINKSIVQAIFRKVMAIVKK